MKVTIENITASCRLDGDLDLESISGEIEGALYQPEIFRGITINKTSPDHSIFLLQDGLIRFHGITSEETAEKDLKELLSLPSLRDRSISEPLKVEEVIASTTADSPMDAKQVYEEFKDEGIIYDPSELPGFILQVGSSGIELLIFPEGKIISRGASNLMDAVSSLQMVHSRIFREKDEE
ncbi:MAG TPA: hypothetical protein ENK47_01065 [Euryarchaeota archaeon]|nr:hypothetical protein [Euryarchaeota archaeon]